MKYLHTMIRISNVDESLRFFCEGLGLVEQKRIENENGRFTLIFLSAPGDESAQIELTYNWDGDDLGDGSRNFGHLAYRVKISIKHVRDFWIWVIQLIDHLEMVIWLLLDHQIKFLSKFCKKAILSLENHGHQ